jgi:cytochrome c556
MLHREATTAACVLLLAACGSESPRPHPANAAGRQAILRQAADLSAQAGRMLSDIRDARALAAARTQLDNLATQVEALSASLKASPRPDAAGLQGLRPDAERLGEAIRGANREVSRLLRDLPQDTALDTIRSTARLRSALVEFALLADPAMPQIDEPAASQPPAPRQPSGARRPFEPSNPTGQPQSLQDQLDEFIRRFGRENMVIVEVEGLPQERLNDLAWSLRRNPAAAAATRHTALRGEGRMVIAITPVSDFDAFVRGIGEGRVQASDPLTRTVHLHAEASGLR